MRKPTLFIAVLGTSLVPTAVNAENSISYQAYNFKEDDHRIEVRGSEVVVENDFGTDYHLQVGVDYDTVTGATPMWQKIDGYANEYEKGQVTLEPETRDGVFSSLLVRDKHRNEYKFGVSWSVEPDFVSRQAFLQGMFWQDESHNRSYTVGIARYFNEADPSAFTNHTSDESSTVDNLQLGVTQVINPRTTLEASLYYGYEEGYLSNQYLKIVRVDSYGTRYLAPDSRPDEREAGGAVLRSIHSLRDGLVAQLWYRYYEDDWGVTGNTVEAKLFWDISPQWRLNPVYRFGTQTAADFYRDYSDTVNYFATTGYGANDERLGAFDTQTQQLNIEFMPTKEWSLNAGFSHYKQDNGYSANWFTAGFVLRY